MFANTFVQRLRQAIVRHGGLFENDLRNLSDEEIDLLGLIVVVLAHDRSHKNEKELVIILNDHLSKLTGWKDKRDHKSN